MTLTIDLPPELEEALKRQVAQTGQPLDDLVLEALHEKLERTQRFSQVCAEFSSAVASSGISATEFDAFFEESREEAWRERQDLAP